MHPGDQVNVTVQVHDKIPGTPPYYRAYDKHGNRLYINFLPLQGIFSSGDQLHLHRYIFIELKCDVLLLRPSRTSVLRKSIPNDRRLTVELCGGTGSMLDATAFLG